MPVSKTTNFQDILSAAEAFEAERAAAKSAAEKSYRLQEQQESKILEENQQKCSTAFEETKTGQLMQELAKIPNTRLNGGYAEYGFELTKNIHQETYSVFTLKFHNGGSPIYNGTVGDGEPDNGKIAAVKLSVDDAGEVVWNYIEYQHPLRGTENGEKPWLFNTITDEKCFNRLKETLACNPVLTFARRLIQIGQERSESRPHGSSDQSKVLSYKMI